MAELLPDPEDPELDKIVYALALEASADGKAASIPRVVERLRPTKTALGFRKPEIGAQRLITEVPCGQADGIGRAGGWRKAGECGNNGMQAWESGAKGTA